jgi:hypothetical protein
MKLRLEVTYVDTAANCVVFKPTNCGLSGDLVYKDLPRRAVEQFKKSQIVEATIPLPDHYPVNNCAPFTFITPGLSNDPSCFETKRMDGKWYKQDLHYPFNWIPIQREIETAIEQVLRTGQPQVIPRCGYVSVEREFIPYIRAEQERAA